MNIGLSAKSKPEYCKAIVLVSQLWQILASESCAAPRGAMKTVTVILLAAIALPGVASLSSCAGLRPSPDPADVRAQIAEYREQETALVRATVSDPSRADRLLALLDERDRITDDYAKRIAEHRQKITALNTDYDAEREEFEALLANFNQQRAAAQRESMDVVAAMKETTTEDEWKKIARFQLKRLDLRQLSYGQAAIGD